MFNKKKNKIVQLQIGLGNLSMRIDNAMSYMAMDCARIKNPRARANRRAAYIEIGKLLCDTKDYSCKSQFDADIKRRRKANAKAVK